MLIPELTNQVVLARLLSTVEKLKTSVTNNDLIINHPTVIHNTLLNVVRLNINKKLKNH